jgi:hypothetical protein
MNLAHVAPANPESCTILRVRADEPQKYTAVTVDEASIGGAAMWAQIPKSRLTGIWNYAGCDWDGQVASPKISVIWLGRVARHCFSSRCVHECSR